MDAQSRALIELGQRLKSRGYRFVTVTPETHRRVLGREPGPPSLRSIFGWNRPFAPAELEASLFDLLGAVGALAEENGLYRSQVRFATIGPLLFAHSGFPTSAQDAVFFGPDTYRFVRLLRSSLEGLAPKNPLRVVDVGCGSGAGGIYAAHLLGKVELVLADINREALALSRVNCAINAIEPQAVLESNVLQSVGGEADLVVANPPYLLDAERRLYRHGGGKLGIALALKIVAEAMARLKPGGRLVLYTGTPILDGSDPFLQAVRPLLQPHGGQFSYEEIDPDVFGEELDRQVYANADRIAVIGLTVIKG
jgi:SAM-dependent methyltransferase